MQLRELTVRNLRVLEDMQVAVEADLVVITGANGSGKSSVLEAIHLLGTGRSFRARRVQDVVRRGSDGLLVRGSFLDSEGHARHVGVERGLRGTTRMRLSGADVRAASELARHLPLVLITPDSQRLLSDGAEARRRLLDWLMFHVEPEYHARHSRYRRALRQRNAMLRQAFVEPREREVWCSEMAQAARQLEDLRAGRLAAALPLLQESLVGLSALPVTLDYEPGWKLDCDLEALLLQGWERDVARGFSSVGPHRADLHIGVHGRPAQHQVSRGEGKLLVAAVLVAFAKVLAASVRRRPLVLVDELASELDAHNRGRLTSALADLGMQTFVTAVSESLVDTSAWGQIAVFRMEQGKAWPVLE